MEQLKSFALLLMFCAAAGFVYYVLLPAGKISQTAKSVLSVFLLFCALTPLFSLSEFQTPVFSADGAAAMEAYDEVFLNEAKAAVLRQADAVVKKYTNLPYTANIEGHISAGQCISIDRIELVFSAVPPSFDGLRQELADVFGCVTLRVDQ